MSMNVVGTVEMIIGFFMSFAHSVSAPTSRWGTSAIRKLRVEIAEETGGMCEAEPHKQAWVAPEVLPKKIE